MSTTYHAIRYAADGSAGEPSDGLIIATGTLREVRRAIRIRLGSLRGRRYILDGAEAYHDFPRGHHLAYGCGGYEIIALYGEKR